MRSERGFTLVEMVVAAVVLAVGVAAATATFGALSRASGLAAEYDRAAILAERRLTEIEAATDTTVTSESGDFGDEAPDYRWEQEVLQTDRDDLQELRLTVSWGRAEAKRSLVVSTYVPVESTGSSTTSSTPASGSGM